MSLEHGFITGFSRKYVHRMCMLGCGADNAQSHCGKLWQKSLEKKHLKLHARRQSVKKVMKMLRGVPKTHVLGQPYSVLFSRFMMDFNQNVQKPWVLEAIDFIDANAMSINTRPLTGAGTMLMSLVASCQFIVELCHIECQKSFTHTTSNGPISFLLDRIIRQSHWKRPGGSRAGAFLNEYVRPP